MLYRLERKQNNHSHPFWIRIFLFLSYSSGIETINTFIHSVVPWKTIPDSRPKWAKFISFTDQNGAKTLPDGAAHTYMAYAGEYPPPSLGLLHSAIKITLQCCYPYLGRSNFVESTTVKPTYLVDSIICEHKSE